MQLNENTAYSQENAKNIVQENCKKSVNPIAKLNLMQCSYSNLCSCSWYKDFYMKLAELGNRKI